MKDLNVDPNGKRACATEGAAPGCCQPAAGNLSSCCYPAEDSWKKGKALVSVIIIIAAIGVGAYSFVRVTFAQPYSTGPVKSFSAGLREIPPVAAENGYQGKPQTRPEDISLNRVLDSLQALDTLATDTDVVFLVLPGEAQNPLLAIPRQVGTVANNLWKSGQRVGVFTLKSSAPDHNQLVRHFSVNTFPCVVILGRQGSASAVSGDISEARLYNAFVLASKPASCCPTPSTASCCPK